MHDELWVAYNECGDLVAESFCREKVVEQAGFFGYSEDEVTIAKVTP